MTKRLSEKQKKNGAGGETRTRKGLPPVDFEPVCGAASGTGLVIDFIAGVKAWLSGNAPEMALSPAIVPQSARRRR